MNDDEVLMKIPRRWWVRSDRCRDTRVISGRQYGGSIVSHTAKTEFRASHSMALFDAEPACVSRHDHQFSATITIDSKFEPSRGIAFDGRELVKALDAVGQNLEGVFLNNLEGLDIPSLENIAVFVGLETVAYLDSSIPSLSNVKRVASHVSIVEARFGVERVLDGPFDRFRQMKKGSITRRHMWID